MASLDLRGCLAVIIVAGVLSLLYHTLPLQAEEVIVKSATVRAGAEASTVRDPGGKEGIATYYATKYNGRRTASGERYRPGKLTAAHPSLPLGTLVRVINLANLREVVVRINDRCRPKRQPCIDLSLAAAKKLVFLRQGVARVRMTILTEDIT